ncbi:GNAT family N-acetyltransferase [Mucilaginibacter antarcticus]|uniref:GNAT family N-acetyltransferase n=1 Tax=Mucilaginibacter antarcticus TaxID=1855725 RepID=A0ABW5XNJ7_9SPHI
MTAIKMELQGNGFTLRNWQLTDAPALQKHADNVNIALCLLDRFPSPYTLANAGFFINLKINENPATNFPIVIDGEVCGVVGIDNFGEDEPLIGYWLSEQYWGKGIVTGAVILFTDYALKILGISQLNAHVSGRNMASMRVLQKAGYIKAEVLKDNLFLRGELLDKHVYTHIAQKTITKQKV